METDVGTDCHGPLSILLVTRDLMVASRIAGAAAPIPAIVETLAPAGTPRGGPYDVVLVDLQTPGIAAADLVAAARSIVAAHAHLRGGAVLAFGPHVATDRLAEASAAGADLVVSRGEVLGSLRAVIDRVRSRSTRSRPTA